LRSGGLLSFPRTGRALRASVILSREKRSRHYGRTSPVAPAQRPTGPGVVLRPLACARKLPDCRQSGSYHGNRLVVVRCYVPITKQFTWWGDAVEQPNWRQQSDSNPQPLPQAFMWLRRRWLARRCKRIGTKGKPYTS